MFNDQHLIACLHDSADSRAASSQGPKETISTHFDLSRIIFKILPETTTYKYCA